MRDLVYLLNLEDKVILIMRERRDEGDRDTDGKRRGKKTERGESKTIGARRKPASQFHYQVLCNGRGGQAGTNGL